MFKKILWYLLDSFGSIVFGIASIVFIARQYGVENTGYLAYVQAVSGMLSFCFVLGIDNIVLKSFLNETNKALITSAALLLRMIGGTVFIFLVYLWVYWGSDVPSEIAFWLIFAVCISQLMGRSSIFRLYFQAQEKPKIISVSTIVSRVIALLFIAFAVTFDISYGVAVQYLTIYSIVSYVILFSAYIVKERLMTKLTTIVEKAIKLVFESRYILLSTMIFPVFMYIDVLIVEHYLSENDLGLYAAAGKLVAQAAFVGHIIVLSSLKELNVEVEKNGLQSPKLENVIALILLVALAGLLLTQIVSSQLIILLFGESFKGADNILNILVAKLLFIYLAALFSRLLVLKGWTHIELLKSLIASISAVFLAWFLIPAYGIYGAAVSSVLAYAIADWMAYALFSHTRFFFFLVIKCMGKLLFRPLSTTREIVSLIKSG